MKRKLILAEVRKDFVEPYCKDPKHRIPFVVFSTHPRFVEGTRLDWGFVGVAIADGYDVHLVQP